MPSEALTPDIPAVEVYEAALRGRRPLWRRAAGALWCAAGLAVLIAFAWAEPYSARLLLEAGRNTGIGPWFSDWVLTPLVMSVRAVILVESFGYVYHRWFQHVGWLTRRTKVIRTNQMYHWVHHMIIYPIGSAYRKDLPYVASEQGIAWSWVAPGVVAIPLFTLQNGLNLGTAVFWGAVAAYAKFVIDLTHCRFHEKGHPWAGSPYFRRLEDIHLLHHWDQRTNFTIVHPLMDRLFGTYRSPDEHRREIEAALKDRDLTVSDLINWRYLLLQATPAEYAAFISQARRHPRSVRKIGRLLDLLAAVREARPADFEARLLCGRALELQGLVSPPEPARA